MFHFLFFFRSWLYVHVFMREQHKGIIVTIILLKFLFFRFRSFFFSWFLNVGLEKVKLSLTMSQFIFKDRINLPEEVLIFLTPILSQNRENLLLSFFPVLDEQVEIFLAEEHLNLELLVFFRLFFYESVFDHV